MPDQATQTFVGKTYPQCTVDAKGLPICRFKRPKNHVGCKCGKDSQCQCCPNGCYWKSMIVVFPNLKHGSQFNDICGVCKDCKGTR